MANTTWWQSIKLEGRTSAERLKEFIHEGNVRRVVVQHEGRTVAEFPLTVAAVGAVVAPVLAAIGTLVALLKDCTLQIERETTADPPNEPQTLART